MKFFLIIIALLSQMACTRLQTINLKPHYYSERPAQIIWIQLAGFTDQHLPLLKFSNPDVDYHTQFESSDCIGKMWSFNLYDIRPIANQSFMSQMTGSKNIKNTCDDFSKKPVWNYLAAEGYKTFILESNANSEESVEKFLSCEESKTTETKNTSIIRMGPESKPGVNSFHYQDQQNIAGGLYYDKSCQKGICYSSFLNNAKKIMANMGAGNTRNFFLLREFSYLKALRKKDISHAREILQDLDKLLSWIELQKRDDVLVLITGAEGFEIEFPKEGKEWAEFEKAGKNFGIRNTTLLGSAFAKGPMSENFCGLYDESEVIKRILEKPMGKKFSWDAFIPSWF